MIALLEHGSLGGYLKNKSGIRYGSFNFQNVNLPLFSWRGEAGRIMNSVPPFLFITPCEPGGSFHSCDFFQRERLAAK